MLVKFLKSICNVNEDLSLPRREVGYLSRVFQRTCAELFSSNWQQCPALSSSTWRFLFCFIFQICEVHASSTSPPSSSSWPGIKSSPRVSCRPHWGWPVPCWSCWRWSGTAMAGGPGPPLCDRSPRRPRSDRGKLSFFSAKLRIFLFCWFCWIDYNDAHPLMFQHAVCSESFEEKKESIDKEKNEQKTFRMFLKYVCDDVVSMMHYT